MTKKLVISDYCFIIVAKLEELLNFTKLNKFLKP